MTIPQSKLMMHNLTTLWWHLFDSGWPLVMLQKQMFAFFVGGLRWLKKLCSAIRSFACKPWSWDWILHPRLHHRCILHSKIFFCIFHNRKRLSLTQWENVRLASVSLSFMEQCAISFTFSFVFIIWLPVFKTWFLYVPKSLEFLQVVDDVVTLISWTHPDIACCG